MFYFKLFILIFLFLNVNVIFKCDVNAFLVKKPLKKDAAKNALKKHSKSTELTTIALPTFKLEAATVEYEESNDFKTSGTTALLQKCDPCPSGILCVPQIQCPAHVRMKDREKPQICDLPGGNFGYCCLTGQNHTAAKSATTNRHPAPLLTLEVIEQGRKEFEQLMQQIENMPAVQRGQPDFLHGIMFHSTLQDDVQNFQQSNSAMQQVITSQVFTKKEQIPLEDIITNNIQVDFMETPLEQHCVTPPTACRQTNARYRTYDGACNNALPQNAFWGSAGQAMERLLPPAYEDGIWTPRLHSKDGTPLMNAREISRRLLTDVNRPHPKHNLLLMQFGQFLAHDVTQTASVRMENGDLIECCSSDNSAEIEPSKRHYACMPMQVHEQDDFYKDYNVRCMNFVRLSLAPNSECRMSYGKQRSKVSHFVDASPVYGSSWETARDLRAFVGGKLRMFNDFGRDLLPLNNDKKACESDEPGKTCFKSGDGRTNQIISLIAVHLLFAREHNRIADILARLNPNFSDEILFQEARRIVIAELQHIVYNEYLPAVIGPVQMQRFRLNTKHHGYCNDYNAYVNPAITNEFSGAAFRMGHSSVDGFFHMNEDNSVVDEIVHIPDVMFNPSRMRKRTYYDDMMKMLLKQPMQRVDSAITYGLTRYLFRGHHPFGLDLAAFNIHRGRDQGLRCYNDYLEVMGHRRIQSFEQLPLEVGSRLSEVYRSPDDIDLWIGGLLEKPVNDGIVGITFAEIIADQFSRFKHGDRYYYEYSEAINPGAFTLSQLHEIRKVTLARLICDNSDHLTLKEVPPMAFVRSDFLGNQPISCDSRAIPSINWEAWRA